MEFTKEEFNFLHDLVLDAYDVEGRLYTKFGVGGDLLTSALIHSRGNNTLPKVSIVTEAYIDAVEESR